MSEKRQPGRGKIPATTWNTLVDMANLYRRTQELGPGLNTRRNQISTDRIKLKNMSGGNLAKGSVLEIGDSLINDPTPTYPWFEGSSPAPDGTRGIAVTLYDALTSKLVECQVSGVCFAQVDINHVQHQWADVDSGSTVLQSHWHGRAEILWRETATTGEQLCLVRLGQMHRGPIKGVITETGGIASGGSGEVTIKWGSGLASPTSTETAWLTHMDGGADADEDADCDIYWDPSQQKYVIHALECSG